MDWVYFDNNATTRPDDAVLEAMREINEQLWANPSSVHRFGQSVRQRVELARNHLATLVGARPREIVFTSGGTEANNLAIRGTLEPALFQPRDPSEPAPLLITSRIEHSAVREPAEAIEQLGGEVVYLPATPAGLVTPNALQAALTEHANPGRTVLITLQWANNETGVIQPIAELAAVLADARRSARDAGQRPRIHFHVDATQAVGKLPVDLSKSGPSGAIDLLTCSAHKFHGPKGVGALFVRAGTRVRRQQHGGPQEHEKRGGTENTPAIVGMGTAAQLAQAFLKDTSRIDQLRVLRDRFETRVREQLADQLDVVIHAHDAERLWNTTNIAFRGIEAEAILLGLSERGVCASAGAACSSGSLEPSPVLMAMGLDEPVAHGSVRFSISRDTRADEIDEAAGAVAAVVGRLAGTLPVGGDCQGAADIR